MDEDYDTDADHDDDEVDPANNISTQAPGMQWGFLRNIKKEDLQGRHTVYTQHQTYDRKQGQKVWANVQERRDETHPCGHGNNGRIQPGAVYSHPSCRKEGTAKTLAGHFFHVQESVQVLCTETPYQDSRINIRHSVQSTSNNCCNRYNTAHN